MKKIKIEVAFLELLLNCLANQKFMPTPGNQSYKEIESQEQIDFAWNKGMEILHGKRK